MSLALGANDDNAEIKAQREFRNTEFLITTGPGPVPSLDGQNIVFGRCACGLGEVDLPKRLHVQRHSPYVNPDAKHFAHLQPSVRYSPVCAPVRSVDVD